MFTQICRENRNTHFMFNKFFGKSHSLWDNVEKYGGARGTTNDVTTWRMRFALLDKQGTRAYTHTHRQICNIYCFSTAFDRLKFLNVTSYVNCLSCLCGRMSEPMNRNECELFHVANKFERKCCCS